MFLVATFTQHSTQIKVTVQEIQDDSFYSKPEAFSTSAVNGIWDRACFL